MGKKIKVTIWSEGLDRSIQPKAVAAYPNDINTVIADFLSKDDQLEVRKTCLDDTCQGLSDNIINSTDVLVWWGHLYHDKVRDDIVDKIIQRIYDGMGFIALHSSMGSKVFKRLMGTTCRTGGFREIGERERVWVIDRGHPIVNGLENLYFDIPHDEMYPEMFDIPVPDELIFISWFQGGEVLRSGCCYKRGAGRIFYFSPGHEEYRVYYQPEIELVITNAVKWAAPRSGPKFVSIRERKPIEDVEPLEDNNDV